MQQRRVRVQSARPASEDFAATTLAMGGPAMYERIRPLGEGTFGKVVLVRHRANGRQEVMKEVQLRGLNQKALLRARDEVTFLKRLHHPHLIAYRASYLEDTT